MKCDNCGHDKDAHHSLGCMRQGCKCPAFTPSKDPAAEAFDKETKEAHK